MLLMGKKLHVEEKKNRKVAKPSFKRKPFFQMTLRRETSRSGIFLRTYWAFPLRSCDYPSPPAIDISYIGH